jgi:hypothetical protein
MAKQLVQANNTSRTEYIFIQNSSVSTGAGLTGLVFNSAGLTADYCVERGARTNIVLATQTPTGAYSSGGFCAVDGTNMPGLYRFDVPNNVFNVAGTDKAVIMLKGATNMAPVVLEYQIVAFNPDDAVRLGLTAIPNVAQGTTGSLPTGNATGAVTVVTNNDKTGYSLTQAFPTNFSTLAITAGGATTVGTNNDKTGYALSATQTFNVTGNITGNLSGSVGSVTGNVTGSVGSVATGGITTASFAAGAINAAAVATGAIDADALATDAVEEIADGILKRNLDSSGNEASTTSSGRTVRNALRILRNKVDASSGTQVDVYNEADTSVIWSQAITTSVSADPIVKVGT